MTDIWPNKPMGICEKCSTHMLACFTHKRSECLCTGLCNFYARYDRADLSDEIYNFDMPNSSQAQAYNLITQHMGEETKAASDEYVEALRGMTKDDVH